MFQKIISNGHRRDENKDDERENAFPEILSFPEERMIREKGGE